MHFFAILLFLLDNLSLSCYEWVREEIENAIGLPEFWEIEKETVETAQRDCAGRQVAGYEAYDQKRK